MNVAYPGREGAHSAEASARLFSDAELQPVPSFTDVVEAVAGGAANAGVLPIESSVSGPVTETHDLLVDEQRLGGHAPLHPLLVEEVRLLCPELQQSLERRPRPSLGLP